MQGARGTRGGIGTLLMGAVTALLLLPSPACGAPPRESYRITVLYDAFGGPSGTVRDWGFAALIEFGGRRILFDTGNDARTLERNVRALHVDLTRLDFAVLSHRHGDHIGGLRYLLQRNPRVRIYAPAERFGVFGGTIATTLLRPDASLPDSMRYFAGAPPPSFRSGSAWAGTPMETVDTAIDVAPGVRIISTTSNTPGTLELHELSLVLTTADGLLVIVGCSHPGIDTILQAATTRGEHVHDIVGGLHWVTLPDTTVQRMALELRDRWQLDQISPGHCTGEPGFAELRRVFGTRYRYAGLGTRLVGP